MAMLPTEEINRIQRTANIVDIIGSYINLEKKGKNYFGVCPFHDDHNPSMSVSEEKQLYTCFVCHATGTVFTFVQNYENVSFIEAVKIVADRVGIELDSGYKVTSKYDKHYELVDLAVKYYQNNLKSSDGKQAREYLKNRGLSEEVINDFAIGLAPKAPDNLTKLLINKGYSEEMLLDTGISNRGSTLYDLFRNRITFPIHNASGKPVGFSARIFDNSDEAKYINTRETKIFKKGEILFNYHRAQNEARRLKYLLVVEGQMDAIRIYSCGLKNVVATMGTALTNEHIKLLKKLNTTIVLCMDNDSAGEKATITNGELLADAQIDLKVLRISGAKDPDEYLLKYSVEEFKDAINHAISFFDFKLNYLKKNKNFSKVDDVSEYINSVIAELNKTHDDILIDLTVNRLSEEYHIDRNILLNKIIKVETPKTEIIVKPKKIPKARRDKLFDMLIFYMMNGEKYIKLYEQELSYLPDEKYVAIAEDILAFFIKYNYINMADFITYEIDGDNYEKVLDIVDNYALIELNDGEYIGLIEKIKKLIDEERISKLREQLKRESDINAKLKIADEITRLKKRMCNL